MSHCIFVREYIGSKARPPVMIAYDISDRDDAESIVQRIARSYPVNGIDHGNHIHWFYHRDRRHEIYMWPADELSEVEHSSNTHHVEECHPRRRKHVPAPVPRQGRQRLSRHFG